MKILDKPLVKLVPVHDTLSDIFLKVNHAAGKLFPHFATKSADFFRTD